MNWKKCLILISFILILCFTPVLAYAQDTNTNFKQQKITEQADIVPVTKVNVEFRFFTAEPINSSTAILADGGGYWQLAETYTAVAGGSNGKKLARASETAAQYSPTLLGNTEYTFNNCWIDEFGNEYGTSGSLNGQNFINMFEGYEGPEQTLQVYAQYTANYKYTLYNNEIDNIANGSHSENHIVDSKTGYKYTFKTPADIPNKYTFLYWDGGEYGQAIEGSEFEVPAGSLNEDLTVNFIATYQYIPTSMVKIKYVIYDKDGSENIIKETEPSTELVDIRENAPELKNGGWLFLLCPCTNGIAAPKKVEPVITTTPVEDEPIITTYYIYGILNGEDGCDGQDGVDGKNGIDGKDGVDGQDGVDGINGKDGIDGQDGENGRDGKDGIDGVNGKDGIDGKNGKQGPQGDKGDTGTKGAPGINGINGRDGAQGAQGLTGLRGPAGQNGITTINYTSSDQVTPTLKDRSITPQETISENETALNSGIDNQNWALLNFLFMLATIIIPIFIMKKQEKEENKDYKYINNILPILFSIIAVMIFILTENIWLPMVLVDNWTILMIGICICSIISRIFTFNIKEKEQK